MKHNRINADYIEDILNALSAIEKFVKGYTYQDFVRDEKTYEAVIRKFGIIGEAANKLTQDFREQYPEIPWREIISMRNKVIHDYFGIDLATIWDTIENSLPELKTILEKIWINIQKEGENQ